MKTFKVEITLINNTVIRSEIKIDCTQEELAFKLVNNEYNTITIEGNPLIIYKTNKFVSASIEEITEWE